LQNVQTGSENQPLQCVLGLRSALFRDLTQRRLVVQYRRFGTTCRFSLQGPSSSSYSGGSLKYCFVLGCFAGGKAAVAWRWTLTSSNAFVVSRNEQTQEEALRGHTRDSYNTIITAVPWTRRKQWRHVFREPGIYIATNAATS